MSRSFTIDKVYIESSLLDVPNGRYLSKTPSSAVKKMFSKVMKSHDNPQIDSLIIHVQETTKNSAKKIYKYKVTRETINKKVIRDGREIVYKYVTRAKAI